MNKITKGLSSLILISLLTTGIIPVQASEQGHWVQKDSGKWYYYYTDGTYAMDKVIDGKYYVYWTGVWDGKTLNSNTSNEQKTNYSTQVATEKPKSYIDLDDSSKPVINTSKTYTFIDVRGDFVTTDNPKIAEGEILVEANAGKMISKDETTGTYMLKQAINNGQLSYAEFTEIADEKMLELVNEHRAENGKKLLKRDKTLEAMATEKSQHMVDHNYMDHVYKGFNTSQVQELEWKYPTSGENCLANYAYPITNAGAIDMAISMFNQWKASPGHDRAMLTDSHTLIGFGFAFGNNNTQYASYATQTFADNEKDDFEWTSDRSYKLKVYPYSECSGMGFANSEQEAKYLGGLKNLN